MEDLRALLKEYGDEATRLQMEAYMKNNFSFLGIKTPLRRELTKDFLREKRKDKNLDWDFIFWTWQQDEREFQYLGLDYLKSMDRYLKVEDLDKIRFLATTKSWWDSVDGLHRSLGRLSLRDERLKDLMFLWSQDENMWIRRLAIDHQLHLKEDTDRDLLEKIIKNNLESQEFFINKAIGWSLRDYGKTDSAWVKNFLEENKEGLSNLSIREASKYLGQEEEDERT